MQVLILVFVLIGLSFVINFLLIKSVGGLYRILVGPGIIVHELSHAGGCLVTGAPIKKVSLFKKEGGEVAHGKTKIPIIGPIIVSLAPFVVGSIAIYYLAKLAHIGMILGSIEKYDFPTISLYLKQSFLGVNIRDIWFWVWFYLIISVAVSMTPSKQDIKNTAISFFVIGLIGFLIFRFTSFRPNFDFLPVGAINGFLLVVDLSLIMCLFLSILIYTVMRAIKI